MSDDEYSAFAARSIDDFSADLAQADSLPLEIVHRQTVELFANLLPQGRATPGHHFESVVVDGRVVGQLWLGPDSQQSDRAFVYDIQIDETDRGQGFGRDAMLAAENLARQDGLTAIGLSVFGFKTGALKLYGSLGYEVVATSMLKRLDESRLDSEAS
jgi:ribosomal protein S18 acetylase RimI-like enzyme